MAVHFFESPIEEKMGAILDSLGIEYETQVEVGEQRYGGQCRSRYGCVEMMDYEDRGGREEDEEWDCPCGGHPDFLHRELCEWYAPIKVYALYRLDFAVRVGSHKIAIECDGYNYHMRFDYQILNDLKRDKWLKDDGWVVRRFSSTRINNSAKKVGKEIEELIRSLGPKPQETRATLF